MFLYKLIPGQVDKSFGLSIANKVGISPETISIASAQANEMNKYIDEKQRIILERVLDFVNEEEAEWQKLIEILILGINNKSVLSMTPTYTIQYYIINNRNKQHQRIEQWAVKLAPINTAYCWSSFWAWCTRKSARISAIIVLFIKTPKTQKVPDRKRSESKRAESKQTLSKGGSTKKIFPTSPHLQPPKIKAREN